MSDWGPADWAIFFGAVVTTITAIIAVLTPFILSVIKAIKENTAVTVANTVDREVKTQATNAALSEITSQVRDIHAGVTSAPTVVVTAPPAAPVETPAATT